GMARREVRGQRRAAEGDGIAVVEDAVGLDGRKGFFVPEVEIPLAAAGEERGVPFARREFRAGQALELRQAAGVIEMGVAAEQDLDVLQLEPELLDIRL